MEPEDGLKAFVISCYILFGVCGNLLIIVAVARKKKLRVTTSVFIVNVAISDLLVAALVMPTILVNLFTHGTQIGHEECIFFAFVLLMSCGVSLISLSMIAFNRYISICHHTLYKRIFVNRNVVFILGGIWLFSFSVVAIGVFTNLAQFGYDPRLYCCTYINRQSRIYTVLLMTVGIVLPSTLTSFGYIKIFLKIRESQQSMAAHSSSVNSTKEKRAVYAMFTAFAAFAICWFPYGTVAIIDAFAKNVSNEAHLIVAWLAFGNCSLNWLIYGGLNSNFREGYKKILFCKKRSRRTAVVRHYDGRTKTQKQSTVNNIAKTVRPPGGTTAATSETSTTVNN